MRVCVRVWKGGGGYPNRRLHLGPTFEHWSNTHHLDPETAPVGKYTINNNNNNIYLTAVGLSPGGSGF
jgi:hypothetical protein